MRRLFLVAVGLLGICLAGPAHAQWATEHTIAGDCGSATLTTLVDPGEDAYFCFIGTQDSPYLEVEVEVALACLNANTDGTDFNDAQMLLRHCSPDPEDLTAAVSDNLCAPVRCDTDGDGDLESCILTGDDGGSSGTQNRCRLIRRGVYYFDNQQTANGESAVVHVKAIK